LENNFGKERGVLHTQLRAFGAVASQGSFSKAAEALGLTQPALTIQVKALEARHGVKLFNRNGRLVTLTETGRALFRITQRFGALEEHAREVLTGANELNRGELRIAADGPHIVMGLFARFLERYPNVRLSVAMGNTGFVRRQLLDGLADIAVLPGIDGHRRVHALHLWRHTLVVVVANDHPWARRASIAIEELDGQPVLGREEGSTTHRLLRAAARRAGIRPQFVLELGSREAVCEAATAGIGIGCIWELEARGSTRFTTLPIRNASIHSTDYVACLKGERSRQAVKAFFAIAAEFARASSGNGHEPPTPRARPCPIERRG
jgi:aminoethylphosphonate catabolism LysR family transcriptional regulator